MPLPSILPIFFYSLPAGYWTHARYIAKCFGRKWCMFGLSSMFELEEKSNFCQFANLQRRMDSTSNVPEQCRDQCRWMRKYEICLYASYLAFGNLWGVSFYDKVLLYCNHELAKN